MKHTLMLLFLCAATAVAATITVIPTPPAPGEYILQITTDLGINETGPDPYCCGPLTWSGSGIIDVLIRFTELGAIKNFGFLPCPVTGNCDLTETVFDMKPPVLTLPPPNTSSVPEPSAFLTVLAGIACLIVSRRRLFA